jgi:WD40 repeat protein
MAETKEVLRPPSRGITRRAVIIGLATGGIILAGGGLVFGPSLLRHHPLFTYRGHTDAVFDAAWAPDGERIASASSDKTVQVCDASDGRQVITYRGHTENV